MNEGVRKGVSEMISQNEKTGENEGGWWRMREERAIGKHFKCAAPLRVFAEMRPGPEAEGSMTGMLS